MSPKWLSPVLASLVLVLLPNQGWAQVGARTTLAKRSQRFMSFDYADINNVIAGAAVSDRYFYAADPLKLRVIRIDLSNGTRQVIAAGPRLFDFPSSLSFLPTVGPMSELVIVSNQQERTPLTNDAVSETTFKLPFVVAKVLIVP